MRIKINGIEYVSGVDFMDEFCAAPDVAAMWRCEGMPFVRGEELGLTKGVYFYPTKECHEWFSGN